MTLTEFKDMWQADGTQLVEHRVKDQGGARWFLWSAEFPRATYDYGRHMAMILKVEPKTGEILMHDLLNQRGSVNWTREIEDWFNNHVGRY